MLAALRLQIEWGADEALEDAPIDRRLADARLVDRRPAMPAASPSPTVVAQPLRPPPQQHAAAVAAAADSIPALRAALEQFDGCALRVTATNLVFADGDPTSGVVLIGEAPGAEEDRAGRPFVGPSGQLLDRMLASIGLDRSRVLITNLIPWRPPGNRAPSDAEVAACLPFLQRHLALLRPRLLLLLGGLPTKALTGNPQGISRVRGRWQEVVVPGLDRGIPALPTFHPAYLLRTHGARREAWADLIMLRRAMDLERSESRPEITVRPAT